MEGDFIKINEWLTPLSWLYGCGVRFRNTLFDAGILKSHSFEAPVISVGNITVGGTGKTPHVEYLVDLLQEKARVAVLSRGYKRKSHGFLVANEHTPMRQIGDEPYQMKQKFPNVIVAVDKKRRRAIEELTSESGDYQVDVVLLDDAFQHRYVKPGVNILLVDYHRLIIYDKLLPAGRLREPLEGKSRADIVIVTKCPKDLKPMEFRVILKAMNLFAYQKLYFTTLEYEALHPLFNQKEKDAVKQIGLEELRTDDHILLLTGIASPEQVKLDIENASNCQITQLEYPDHHAFRRKDIERINSEFDALPSPKLIITTEKDATRLMGLEGLSDEVRRHLYVLPVKVRFMLDQEEYFNESILDYVRKNSRNSILAQGKDDNIPKDSHRAGNGFRTISFRNY